MYGGKKMTENWKNRLKITGNLMEESWKVDRRDELKITGKWMEEKRKNSTC